MRLFNCLRKNPVTTIPQAPIQLDKKYLVGVDIFWKDEVTNWKTLSENIDFMFIKATEGDWRDDPKFNEYRAKAKEYGIPCGFYHFYRSNKDPIEQAKDFIRVVGDIKEGELPPVLDWETEDDKADGNDAGEVDIFLHEVSAKLNCTPIIYSGSYFIGDKKLPSKYASFPLWLAHYTKNNPRVPSPWSEWTFWQFTDKGIIKGIKNPCDVNYFNGGRKKLQKFLKY